MIEAALQFWNAISGKVKSAIKDDTRNTFRCERYKVTTAPNGKTMGVTLPMGSNEIFLPYSQEVSSATVGRSVLVVWWGSMSNAKVYYYADGYNGMSDYKIYNSVTDLGLTAGSATIVGAWNAMPNGSILICPRGDFPAAQLPVNAAGEVEIVKNPNGVVGFIYFHGKMPEQGDFRMFINGSNEPDGTWKKLSDFGFYNSVTDIGLTSGSATIAGAWTAMPEDSVLIATGADFTTSTGGVPSIYGTVEIVKRTKYRGWVYFHGTSNVDYVMDLDTSNATVTGTWKSVGGRPVEVYDVVLDNISMSASLQQAYSGSVARSGYTPIGIAGTFVENASSGGSGASWVLAGPAAIRGSNYSVRMRNFNTAAVKVKLTVSVLYTKN